MTTERPRYAAAVLPCIRAAAAWRLRLPALLAALLLAAGCPKEAPAPGPGGYGAPPDPAMQTEAQDGAENGASGSAAAPDSAEPAPTGSGLQEGDNDPGQSDDDAADPAAKPQPVWVEVRLSKAEHNPAPDADLSILSFEATARMGRMSDNETQFTMQSAKAEAYGEVSVGFCKVRLYPYVEHGMVDGTNATQKNYISDGRYAIAIMSNSSELLGMFEVDKDGNFRKAPQEKQPAGYGQVPIFADRAVLGGYKIVRDQPGGGAPEAIVEVRSSVAGFETQYCIDPEGNRYTYRFPAFRIQAAPPGTTAGGRP